MIKYGEKLHDLLYSSRLKSALIEQHKKWFDYENETIKSDFSEKIVCPVCGADSANTKFKKDLFQFSQCRECSMVYLNPRLNLRATYDFYNEGWTAIYNETKFLGETPSTQMDDQINAYNLRLIEERREPSSTGKGVLLEIGFGSGFFLRTASAAGYEVHGIDVDTNNCERARKKFGERIRNADLFDAKFESERFDVVYMRDVFEHVPNPKILLEEVRRILKPRGVIFIEVPNIEALVYKIVKERHVCVFGFAHLNYWSPKTLTKILGKTEFEVLGFHHESVDFTILSVANYFLNSAFTTILPIPTGFFKRTIAWIAAKVFSRGGFRQLDAKFSPKISDSLGRGSEIKVIARKLR